MIKDFTCFLNDIYLRKKSKNQSYSKRAFARDLGLSSSFASDLMLGHRNISKDTAACISRKLLINPIEQELFIVLAELANTLDQQLQVKLLQKISLLNFRLNNITNVKENYFRVISHWYTGGVMVLLEFYGNNPEWEKIAHRLQISAVEVENLISDLIALGFLKIENGKYVKSNSDYIVEEVPSNLIRQYHEIFLSKAQAFLNSETFDIRDYSSFTLAFQQSRMNEMREDLRQFREKMIHKYANLENNDVVYQLNIQLFRLDVHGDS